MLSGLFSTLLFYSSWFLEVLIHIALSKKPFQISSEALLSFLLVLCDSDFDFFPLLLEEESINNTFFFFFQIILFQWFV